MKKVFLCKGCIDLMKQEYGTGLGFTEPVAVTQVDSANCDMRSLKDGTLAYEHINWAERKIKESK